MAARKFAGQIVDARPDKLDLRDRMYAPPLRRPPDEFPDAGDIEAYFEIYTKKLRLVRDQKQEGACTGFGLAAVINYLLFRRAAPTVEDAAKLKSSERVSPWMIYQLARRYDEWPGEDYEGSSCRGAMKGWFHHGVCIERKWSRRNGGRRPGPNKRAPWQSDAPKRPLGAYYRIDALSIADMQSAICETGAIYCSATVHDGWVLGSSETLPQIDWQTGAPSKGGHAFALVGYDAKGFYVQNSWGADWGCHGFARLTYEDWLVNGFDAWVAMLGVPIETVASDLILSSRAGAQGVSPASVRGLANGANAMSIGRAPSRDRWAVDKTLDHALVVGHRGIPETTLVSESNSSESAQRVLLDNPDAWFSRLPAEANGKKRLAIYFHGGLNDLEAGLARTSVLGPWFEDNGVYPIFVNWRSGVLESVQSILRGAADAQKEQGAAAGWLDNLKSAASAALDRLLEAVASVPGSALWNDMKTRCVAAAAAKGAAAAVAGNVAQLLEKHPGLELHLVGHSAGSIMIGAMLGDLAQQNVSVAGCTLFAPACTVDFALSTYGSAAGAKVLPAKALDIYILSDENETADTVGPYGKSLLYLVSRAFEAHKTPILGMEAVWSPDLDKLGVFSDEDAELNPIVKKWRSAWKGAKPFVLRDKAVKTGPTTSQPASHGCFDNSVKCMTETINRIRGLDANAPLRHGDSSLEY